MLIRDSPITGCGVTIWVHY